MLMRRIAPLRIFFCASIFSYLLAENELHLVEYIEIPKELQSLRLKPDKINWSMRNSFLLLDSYNSELVLIKNSGEIQFSNVLGIRYNVHGELTWAGNSPIGIQVVDRLENEIIILDLNLNLIQNIPIDFYLYPEIVQIDTWGKLFMYSSTYNGIYLFEKNYISKVPFIDFYKIFYSNYCIKDFAISRDGKLAILGCDGILSEFSQNGLRLASTPIEIFNPNFLVPLYDDWLIINSKGECQAIYSSNKISLPRVHSEILDVAELDRSIAILTKEQILVLNVR